MPNTMSSSLSMPAMPRRGLLPTLTVAMSLMVTGEPLLALTMVLRISSIERTSPTLRTTAAWGPKLTVCPPTLELLLLSACSTCGTLRLKRFIFARSMLTSNAFIFPPQPVTSITPGTALKRRWTIQSWMVLRSVTE